MQDLLAFNLTLAAPDPAGAFADISRRAAEWGWGRTGQALPDVLAAAEGSVAGPGGFELHWSLASVPERAERGLEIELRHPAEDDPGLRWRTAIEVVETPEALRLGVHVAREAISLALRPAEVDLGPPRLVGELVGAYPCFAGSVEVTTEPVTVQPSEAAEWLVPMLELAPPERVLPVVVVAPTDAVDAGRLARRLLGLAHVVRLSGYLAYRRLQEGLPEAFTPPGGVRLYWPGFAEADDRLRHPYWTSRRIAELREPLEDVIFRMLARISVVRVPRDPLLRELRALTRARRRTEVSPDPEAADWKEIAEIASEELAEKDEQLASKDRAIAEREEEIARLRGEREEDPEIARLRQENANLTTALENSQANLALYAGRAPGEEEAEDEEDLAAPADWVTLVGRLDGLAVETGGALVVTDNARRAAEHTSYPDPTRMWDHLERLGLAAIDFREAKGAVGARLEDWFVQYGLDYAPHDSNLGGWSDFQFEGRAYSREPHIKVDDAKHGSAQVGRIYFAPDAEGGRFIVDHIGSKPY